MVQEGTPCPDLPAAYRSIGILSPANAFTARVTTDAEGYFLIELPAGPYRLQPQLGPLESMQATVVEIAAGQVTQITLLIDSGIR